MVNAAKLTTPEISMPMARRASLHRFLEKRKDRINSRAPYQLNDSSKIGSTTKPLEAKSWLGLGQEISN
ncbi:uncharacterized protein A4U43_C06F3870 [Asparagus officinalis]|uniref:Uncharacterized protein n=1 Tax=Asparagus officinalis TaxID=4686 RepID=A0A5P1EJE8_ASPOF|nr:uncharacterized protein A4U43_C06F3870 [Asparagus officinalis]